MVRVWLMALAAVVAGCSRKAPEPPPNAAVDARQCAGCHAAHAKTFHQTGMGRSFYPATPANMVENFDRGASFYHKPSDRYYQVSRRGDQFFLRRHQIGFNAAETNVVEREIHYVMGSGNHARTYVHRTADGKLIELPVGWYPENGGTFAMSPGYDRAIHPDFRRQIRAECLFCHNALPRAANEVPGAIDCQRCHGPGRAHIDAAQKPNRDVTAVRAAIVNPARLSADRQAEVCMQCHLETTSSSLPESLRRLENPPYQPGQPLSDAILFFDHAPGAGHDDKFEIVNSVYRLRKSACFQKSGTLTCTTCHNPHDVPRGKAAADHYTSVCKQCHATLRNHQSAAPCADCHMPRRRTEDVIHAVMTDHLIQRRPAPRLLAPRAENSSPPYRGEVILYYPTSLADGAARDLYVAAAQVVQGSNLAAGIPRFEAALEKHKPKRPELYHELGQAYTTARRRDRAIAWYERALARDAGYVPSLRSLGVALMQDGQADRARDTLERAAKLAPNDGVVRHELGLVYRHFGRAADAISALQDSIRLEPDSPEGYNSLGGALLDSRDRTGAEAAFRNAIKVQPEFAEAHSNLAMLLAGNADGHQAEHHFQLAIRHNPQLFAARFNFGSLLAATGRFAPAEEQIEAAVRIEPGRAEAREMLGSLQARRGAWPQAIAHYREALRLQPNFDRAHLSLAIALGSTRDLIGAREHLTLAAKSSDPVIRQDAIELLQSMTGAR